MAMFKLRNNYINEGRAINTAIVLGKLNWFNERFNPDSDILVCNVCISTPDDKKLDESHLPHQHGMLNNSVIKDLGLTHGVCMICGEYE